jgi:hypothetical protein
LATSVSNWVEETLFTQALPGLQKCSNSYFAMREAKAKMVKLIYLKKLKA